MGNKVIDARRQTLVGILMKNTSPFLLTLILLAGWLSSRSGNKIALIAAINENAFNCSGSGK